MKTLQFRFLGLIIMVLAFSCSVEESLNENNLETEISTKIIAPSEAKTPNEELNSDDRTNNSLVNNDPLDNRGINTTDLNTTNSINTTNTTNFITVTFNIGTTQQEINDALNIINPVNYFTCPNSPHIIVMSFTQNFIIEGTGRGSGSSGKDLDPAIESMTGIPYIAHYRFGIHCE
ncbi:MAG: hypothetical protein AB8B52_06910 [Winogradskyella sp.]|uniref:hypothetical protein n=1 Tax=Winogradskyella sp. TaxID=1883156 RepID=UPI003858B619